MRKLKLLVIELDYHADLIENLIELLSDSEVEINLLTTEKIARNISNIHRVRHDLKPKRLSISNWFNASRSLIESTELVYFNTLASNYQFFASYTFKQPTVLRIHNANAYLNPLKSLNPDWSDLRYFLNHLIWRDIIRRDWLYKSRAIRKMSYFMFPSSRISSYVIERGLVDTSKVLHPELPYGFTRKKSPNLEENRIKIAIPGTVEQKRRDYDLLIKAIELAAPHFIKKVEFVFLGRILGGSGKQIAINAAKIKNSQVSFRFYDKFIPIEEFEAQIASSHFMVSPLKILTNYQIYREIYGKTKISGIEKDMILYQKPVILPLAYELPDELKKYSEGYTTVEHLSSILIQWINQAEYEMRKFSSSTALDKEIVSANFINLCRRLIDSPR